MSDTFSILTVCTGNICRSPMAEQLLRHEFESLAGLVSLSSGGTMAMLGSPMPEQAANLSLRHGGDPANHAGSDLTERRVAGSDLVLAMAREHRAATVSMHPRATRYTFTLRQFARLAASVPPELLRDSTATTPADRLRELVVIVAQQRGLAIPLANPEDDDVIDPFRQEDSVYEESAAQLVPAAMATAAYFAEGIRVWSERQAVAS